MMIRYLESPTSITGGVRCQYLLLFPLSLQQACQDIQTLAGHWILFDIVSNDIHLRVTYRRCTSNEILNSRARDESVAKNASYSEGGRRRIGRDLSAFSRRAYTARPSKSDLLSV